MMMFVLINDNTMIL